MQITAHAADAVPATGREQAPDEFIGVEFTTAAAGPAGGVAGVVGAASSAQVARLRALVRLRSIRQDRLAEASGLSEAIISRMLTRNSDQQRKDPKLSTLRKLQHGLEQLTGRTFTLETIGAVIAG